MFSFTKKRFITTLVLSSVIWYTSVLIQGFTGFNAPYNMLFTSSTCKLTGFPIADCRYSTSVWLINLINIIFWFWVVHLFWGWFEKGKSQT